MHLIWNIRVADRLFISLISILKLSPSFYKFYFLTAQKDPLKWRIPVNEARKYFCILRVHFHILFQGFPIFHAKSVVTSTRNMECVFWKNGFNVHSSRLKLRWQIGEFVENSVKINWGFVSFNPSLRVNFLHSLPSPIQINGNTLKGYGGGAITVLLVNVWIFELSRKMCSSLFTVHWQLMQCIPLSLYSVERPHNVYITNV